ncbi:hypothetical protein KSP39_PZI007178 [Platanthera zijinensis]|uniref:Protein TRIGALACTOSYLDIACYLGLYCEROL 4, chloroplastic n=1 Tax=Platanthera zijinensis TaxID=2320716 RepID=A0AAP0BQA5_9ASPA
MRRLRWVVDGGGWELDAETPVTMEGTARAVPGDPLPLGISRGGRLSRSKQLDFLHRFMASPLVPSFGGDPTNGGQGVVLHHAHTFHIRDSWSATVLEQFNLQNFLASLKETTSSNLEDTLFPKIIARNVLKFLSLGCGTEFFITPESSVLFEAYNDKRGSRGKSVFLHKSQRHNLMLEAACPQLFIDKKGEYWDVPLSMSVDLASVTFGSGLNYRLLLQQNSGQPKHFCGTQTTETPLPLLPGLCAKAAISIKKYVKFWRKKEGKLKLVQPYDVFLSDPHISGVGILGAVASASLGENSARYAKEILQSCNSFNLSFQKDNFALFSDVFASVTLKSQLGNFQRFFLDLTKFDTHLDFSSGSTFLFGALSLAKSFYNSQKPDAVAIRAISPNLRVSLQQQIFGPFSFHFNSRVLFHAENGNYSVRLDDSIFAIDWALKVLGSAKASFWYSPKHQEAMVELRFFES